MSYLIKRLLDLNRNVPTDTPKEAADTIEQLQAKVDAYKTLETLQSKVDIKTIEQLQQALRRIRDHPNIGKTVSTVAREALREDKP